MRDYELYEDHTVEMGECGTALVINVRTFFEIDGVAWEPASYKLVTKTGHVLVRGSKYTSDAHMWATVRHLTNIEYEDRALELWDYHEVFEEPRAMLDREHQAEIIEFRRAVL